ncbi:MAG: glycosyltransferase [Chloroflexota bacterium]
MTNRLKILHVYKDYWPIVGGIENHIKTLAEAQVQAGHDVTVLVTNPAKHPRIENINGVQVIRASRLATVASTPLSLTFPLHLLRQRPDMTHLHFPYPLGELSQWLFGNGRSYVITYHSDVVKQQQILRFYNPLLRRVLKNANQIIPTSHQYVASSPYLNPLADQCTVVPLSVDAQPYMKAEPLFAKNGRLRLLFVGQHRYYKGVDDLIKAMPQIDAELLIGGDGPMRSSWEETAVSLQVSDKVNFVGRVSDEALPKLFASADIFVLPANARSEAFGKVLLEAMATGIPCITTEVGTGTSFVVEDEVTGWVVHPKNPDGLATAVNTLLNNPEMRVAMGRAGQQRALTDFSVEQMVTAVDRVYRQVLTSQKP